MTRLACAFQVALITLVAILTAPAVMSADTLTGSIVDAQGLALVNANVRLLDRFSGEQRNTVSGPDGRYSFPELLRALCHRGRCGELRTDRSRGGDAPRQSDAEPDAEIAATQSEVQVTASSTPQAITEVAKAVDVVSGEEINLRGVFQISEAIRVLPGIQVKTLEGPGSLTTIRTEGFGQPILPSSSTG